jgi:hypothetical protein
MNLTEAKLEEAIIELLGEGGYPDASGPLVRMMKVAL